MTGVELEREIDALGLSHNKFAELAGIKYPSLRAILKGSTVNPKPETAERIAAVLAKKCPHCGQYWESANETTSGRTERGQRRQGR